MNRRHFGAATLFGLLLAGCGGGGGSTTPPPPVDPVLGTVVVEAQILSNGLPTGAYQDPLNIEVQQNVRFVLANYANGIRSELPTDNWSTNDVNALYGTLSVADGNFVAGRNQSPTDPTLFVTTRYRGVDYFTAYAVKPRQAVLSGRIVDTAGNPVRGVTLEFFDVLGRTVGTVRQPVDGVFRASVPVNTVRFTVVNNDSLPTTFQRGFRFGDRGYRAADGTCYASVGDALTVGLRRIGDIVLVPATDAPLDFDGCGL